MILGAPVRAEEPDGLVTVEVEYGVRESTARAMLEYVNKFRTGQDIDGQKPEYRDMDGNQVPVKDLIPLEYDYDLEKVAVQRAIEIALKMAHEKPDGRGWYEGDPEGIPYWSRGENIAGGQTTHLSVFRAWREDEEDYYGQGHRRNMLSENYNCIGIGHVYLNGVHYWTQELGYRDTEDGFGIPTEARDATVTSPVRLWRNKMGNISLSAASGKISVQAGKTKALPKVSVSFTYQEGWPWPGDNFFTGTPEVSWTSSQKSIAVISGTKVKGVSPGKATLKASALGLSVNVTATVTAAPAPVITAQPEGLARFVGETASFSVSASGSGLSYRWQCSSDEGKTWRNVTDKNEGWNGPKLSVTVKDSLNGYQYRCVVTGNGQSVNSEAARLSVQAQIVTQPSSKGRYAGDSAKFTVKATGAGLTYRWQCSSDAGKTWRNVSEANQGWNGKSLTIVAKGKLNGYRYRCVITDAYGVILISNAVKLNVPLPKILTQPAPKSVKAGAKARFTIEAEGYQVKYRWQCSSDGGTTWRNVSDKNEGFDTNQLTLTTKSAWNGYLYRCRVTDTDGRHSYSDAAKLTVK